MKSSWFKSFYRSSSSAGETLRSGPAPFNFPKIDTTSTELWVLNHGLQYIWRGSTVKIKSIWIACKTTDSVSQPVMTIKIDKGNSISQSAMTLSAVDAEWKSFPVSNTPANLLLPNGSSLDFEFTKGGAGDGTGMQIFIEVEET